MFPFKEAIQILITESSSPYFAALSPSCSSLAVTQALRTLMKCRIFVFNVGQSWNFLIQASVVWPPPKRDGEEWKLRYALLCMRLDISRYARVCGLIRRPFPIFVFYFPCLATLAAIRADYPTPSHIQGADLLLLTIQTGLLPVSQRSVIAPQRTLTRDSSPKSSATQ